MKKMIIAALAVIAAAGAAFYLTHKDFVLGRIGMSFTNRPMPASATDTVGEARSTGRRILVAYFSWGGNTRRAAQEIHRAAGGDIVEIRAVKAYPSGYRDTAAAAKPEFDGELLPEVDFAPIDMDDYDVIMLGYPIWYGREPRAIASFLSRVDTRGRTILPFATSGGSGIEPSIQHIAEAAPGAALGEPLLANDRSLIPGWVERNLQGR